MTTVYLTVAEVLAIHADQIERYGGSTGLRDPGQLEAALFRPQTGYYADLIAEAAARELGLAPGVRATALVKASDVLLAVTG